MLTYIPDFLLKAEGKAFEKPRLKLMTNASERIGILRKQQRQIH